jgi:hypothetical protein
MTTAVQKRIERNYLDEAIRSLKVGWTILEERDPPDFIIADGDRKFGLDVAEIFHGRRTASGSQMKKTESDMQKQLDNLRREYELQTGVILSVKFVGRIAPDTLPKVVPELLALDLATQPLAYHTTVEILSGFEAPLKLHVTKSNRPDWLAVGHYVGFVTRNPDPFIAEEIAKKSLKLAQYKSLAGTDDVRLLLVATR